MLYQRAGLVNGAMGTVKEVVWSKDSTPTSRPEFVVIDFPNYTGPVFPKWAKDPKKRTWVPIGTVRQHVEAKGKTYRGPVILEASLSQQTHAYQSSMLQWKQIHLEWEGNCMLCTRGTHLKYHCGAAIREQIPITPTRSLTFYKAQGTTLKKVQCDMMMFMTANVKICMIRESIETYSSTIFQYTIILWM